MEKIIGTYHVREREREREKSVTQDHEGEEYPMYNKKEEGYLHFSPLALELTAF